MASGLNINPGVGRQPGIDYSMVNFLQNPNDPNSYGHFERGIDPATGFMDNTVWVPAGVPAPANAPTLNDFYSWAVPDESIGSSFMDFAKNAAPLAAGFAGLGFGLGGLAGGLGGTAAGAGAAESLGLPSIWGGSLPFGSTELGIAGTAAGASAAGSTNGGGMWDWLDQLIGNAGTSAGEAENLGSMFDPSNPWGSALSGATSGGTDWSNIDQMINNLGSNAWEAENLGTANSISESTLASLAKKYGPDLARTILNKVGPVAAQKLLGGGGSLWDQLSSDPLRSAFNATPFLLALTQANKQGHDLDQVLSQINGQGYTQSVLNPYDMQTAAGRTSLTDSLTNRGVLGSSFGYNDLNNYQYIRDMGRGDLASKAGLASAGLQGNLINQRNTNTNLLLGAGLNASGRLFSPQKDPFGQNSGYQMDTSSMTPDQFAYYLSQLQKSPQFGQAGAGGSGALMKGFDDPNLKFMS